MTTLKLVVSVDCGFKVFFVWNHNTVTGWGFQGLVAKLTAQRAARPPLRKI